MQHMKHRWKQLPGKLRRPLVLVLGILLIITAGLIGWIPGPGGTIVFLLGVAVLATEFVWAERLRDYLLGLVKMLGVYIQRHPGTSIIIFVLGMITFGGLLFLFYNYII